MKSEKKRSVLPRNLQPLDHIPKVRKEHAFMTGVESESESHYSASRLPTPSASMTSTQVTATKP